MLNENKEIVVRVDGRNFGNYTDKWFKQPFDQEFTKLMIKATYAVMKDGGLPIVRAYTQSDEASFLFLTNTNTYGRRQEKIASIMAGLMTKYFAVEVMSHPNLTAECASDASFDGKVFFLEPYEVEEYFYDRFKNSINNYHMQWSHYSLSQIGFSGKRIADKIHEVGVFEHSPIDRDLFFNPIAYGSGFIKVPYLKKAVNKITQEEVCVNRSRIIAYTPISFEPHRSDNKIECSERYN